MSVQLDTLELPVDLVWADEFQYSDIAQQKQRSLTGALIIQESAKLEGRPITLVGGQESAWATREQVLALQALVDTVDNDMTLTFHGTSYTVRFDREGGNTPVDASPIVACTNPEMVQYYGITIKLMTV